MTTPDKAREPKGRFVSRKPSLCFVEAGLSVLPEVRQSQRGRGLILLLSAQRNADEHYYGDQIREHLEYLLHRARLAGNEVIEPIERAEEVCAPDGSEGLPRCEYYERDGQPAQGLDIAVVRPGTLDVIHDVIQPAQARYARAHAGGNVFIPYHVDARGVGSGGVFAHGAQVEPDARPFYNEAEHGGDDYRKIHHEAVIAEYLVEIRYAVGQVLSGAERRAGHRDGDLAHAAGKL